GSSPKPEPVIVSTLFATSFMAPACTVVGEKLVMMAAVVPLLITAEFACRLLPITCSLLPVRCFITSYNDCWMLSYSANGAKAFLFVLLYDINTCLCL